MLVPVMVAAAALGLQAVGSDASPWETVISREGQFVVDLPAKPTVSATEEQNGPGGRTRFVIVGCDTPAAAYIAEKIVLPTAVVAGAEDLQLDTFREYFAKKYNGRVITEKKIRNSDGRLGRDYTIRAQPQRGGPISTIRIRQFLAGQAIFALIAISADNRELPPDAGRFFGSFAEGTTRQKKVGPRPEPAGHDLPGWGVAIDPDGDCKIRPDGQALVVEVPGTLHDLNADIDTYNAPRILRDVEGDFSLTVKVAGEPAPGGKSTKPKGLPYVGAGIMVWRDSDNYVLLQRGSVLRGGKVGVFCQFDEREGGSRGAVHNGPLGPGPAYLRMERRGSRLFGFTSQDGQHWAALRPIDTTWPARLRVGLDVLNTGSEAVTVRFEGLGFKGRAAAGRP